MAHSYDSEYPPGAAVAPGIAQFISNFYALSDTPADTPGAHERYVDAFTADATFILASKKSVGSDEIRATREGMWAKVASRKHTVNKVFPFGPNSEELMLYGNVAFTFKAGGGAEVDWAGRAQLEKSADGKYRLKFYRVYLAAVSNERLREAQQVSTINSSLNRAAAFGQMAVRNRK